jgi:hypothetical protein
MLHRNQEGSKCLCSTKRAKQTGRGEGIPRDSDYTSLHARPTTQKTPPARQQSEPSRVLHKNAFACGRPGCKAAGWPEDKANARQYKYVHFLQNTDLIAGTYNNSMTNHTHVQTIPTWESHILCYSAESSAIFGRANLVSLVDMPNFAWASG